MPHHPQETADFEKWLELHNSLPKKFRSPLSIRPSRPVNDSRYVGRRDPVLTRETNNVAVLMRKFFSNVSNGLFGKFG